MPDEPSGYELRRNLEDLRQDIREVVTSTGQRIDRKVSMDVWTADLRRLDGRIDDIEQDLAALQSQREKDHSVARQAKQWAVGMGVAVMGVLVAIFSAVIGKV